ncbi:TPA: hypothetical protein QCI16_004339 [Enterobacter ludwigii]|uniref:hypothetical protein n=1 Tax=Enterobacter ludwigii TaxID=299767 RepID=UPI0032F7AE62|nr:hypothetical protein [Enterobacter ludwigii]HDR2600131.1 hypothetical protein [Enterobacter ludwigii]
MYMSIRVWGKIGLLLVFSLFTMTGSCKIKSEQQYKNASRQYNEDVVNHTEALSSNSERVAAGIEDNADKTLCSSQYRIGIQMQIDSLRTQMLGTADLKQQQFLQSKINSLEQDKRSPKHC